MHVFATRLYYCAHKLRNTVRSASRPGSTMLLFQIQLFGTLRNLWRVYLLSAPSSYIVMISPCAFANIVCVIEPVGLCALLGDVCLNHSLYVPKFQVADCVVAHLISWLCFTINSLLSSYPAWFGVNSAIPLWASLLYGATTCALYWPTYDAYLFQTALLRRITSTSKRSYL